MLGLILLVIIVHPDPALHGRRQPADRARAVPDRDRAACCACWFCALAADPHGALAHDRARGADRRAAAGDAAVDGGQHRARQRGRARLVIKNFTFFLSYLLIVYFIASVIRSRRDLDRMLKLLVGGGAIVAVAVADRVEDEHELLQLVQPRDAVPALRRRGRRAGARQRRARARLGAAPDRAQRGAGDARAARVLPLPAPPQARCGSACAGVLTLGALSTGSRTGTTMLIALLVSFLCIRPRETRPAAAAAAPAAARHPGRDARHARDDEVDAQPELRDQGAVLRPGRHGRPRRRPRPGARPLVAEAVLRHRASGPRSPTRTPRRRASRRSSTTSGSAACCEIGAVGVLALLLAVRARRSGGSTAGARNARAAPTSWLATALAASLIAFAVGMLTFDAFAFIQVTFFAFVMLGLAGRR